MPAVADNHHRTEAAAVQPRTKLFAADPIDRRVASRLSARRRALGLTPALLDMILGLRDGTIERLESGESRIAPSHLYHLAHVFEVNIDWFFAEPEYPSNDDAPENEDEAVEARRFLSFFARLSNPAISRHVHEMVKAIAESDSWPRSLEAHGAGATSAHKAD
jgi:transcriptional regulator with XRE-family HTH domain